jgi:hypothetical protein
MSDDSKKNPLFIPTPVEAQAFPDRNPTVVPKADGAKRVCPKCKGDKFGGRRVMGVVTFTCSNPDCRNQWQGGMGEPIDPRKPMPPESYTPPSTFDRSMNPQEKGKVVEVRRAVDLRPEFRKGGLITDDEEL